MMLFLFLENAKWYRPVVANLFNEPKEVVMLLGETVYFRINYVLLIFLQHNVSKQCRFSHFSERD